jgi:REP element-mobilizing transposase RayT
MARKPRLHLPGGLYHIIWRGNEQRDVFFDDGDRERFYGLLSEGVERFGYRVHGFCLMSNHVHLVVQSGDDTLSGPLQNLAFRYTQAVNRKRGRVGHLFQGRYKALLVDQDQYLLELVRYVHLNPVRARLVRDPDQYTWSAHRAYLGRMALPWLTTESVLGQLGGTPAVARERYARFVAEGIGQGHRPEFYSGDEDSRVVGDERFVEQLQRLHQPHLLAPGAEAHAGLALEQPLERALARARPLGDPLQARAVGRVAAQPVGRALSARMGGKKWLKSIAAMCSPHWQQD